MSVRTARKRSRVGDFGHNAVGSERKVAEALDLGLPGDDGVLHMGIRTTENNRPNGPTDPRARVILQTLYRRQASPSSSTYKPCQLSRAVAFEPP